MCTVREKKHGECKAHSITFAHLGMSKFSLDCGDTLQFLLSLLDVTLLLIVELT